MTINEKVLKDDLQYLAEHKEHYNYNKLERLFVRDFTNFVINLCCLSNAKLKALKIDLSIIKEICSTKLVNPYLQYLFESCVSKLNMKLLDKKILELKKKK